MTNICHNLRLKYNRNKVKGDFFMLDKILEKFFVKKTAVKKTFTVKRTANEKEGSLVNPVRRDKNDEIIKLTEERERVFSLLFTACSLR